MPNLEENPLYESMRQMTKVGPETMSSWTRAGKSLWQVFKGATAKAPMGSVLKAFGIDMPKQDLDLEAEVLTAAQSAGILKPMAVAGFVSDILRVLRSTKAARFNKLETRAFLPNDLVGIMREAFAIPQLEFSRIRRLGYSPLPGGVAEGSRGVYYPPPLSTISLSAGAKPTTIPHEFTHARQSVPGRLVGERERIGILRNLNLQPPFSVAYADIPIEMHARTTADKLVAYRPRPTFAEAYMSGLDDTLRAIEHQEGPDFVRRSWQQILKQLKTQIEVTELLKRNVGKLPPEVIPPGGFK